MKRQLLTAGARIFRIASFSQAAVVTLTALSVAMVINQPSQAQSSTFFCGTTSDGTPATLARTPRGTVEVIRWVSRYFSGGGYTPQRRCEEVSGRFENYKNRNMLNFITAGYLNGQPAICVGDGSSPCSSDRLLFTLKPGQNAAREIQQLFSIRSGASGPLYESTGSGSTVIDMNKFLEQAQVIDAGDATATSEQPANTAPATSQPNPSDGRGGLNW
ncbi:MAG: COP23 domain-containing protein [Coleofasciculus sp. S288]|nr:COP23 domain-containing protein [Coleofasciculus sp. S288]